MVPELQATKEEQNRQKTAVKANRARRFRFVTRLLSRANIIDHPSPSIGGDGIEQDASVH
jgi:hypothetical protein